MMRNRSGVFVPSLSSESARALLSMTWPIMAEQACIMLLGLVNAGMAGRSGTDVASAVGLINSITNIVISVFSALALGGTVAVSRARGAGKREDADRAASQCLLLSIGSSLVLSIALIVFAHPIVEALFGGSSISVRLHAASYLVWSAAGYPFLAATLAFSGVLRGAGDAGTPMLINVLMNVVNAAAGRIFIFGVSVGGITFVPELSAAGAGIALSLARVAGTVVYLAAIARGAGCFSFRFPPFRFSPRPVAGRSISEKHADHAALLVVLAVGIPAAVENLAFNGGKLLTQTYVSGLGATAVAADYFCAAAAGFIQAPLSSLLLSVPPVVSEALGRGRTQDARLVVRIAVVWGSILTALINFACYIFTPEFLSFFTDDPAVLAISIRMFHLYCVACPFLWAASFIVPAGLRGAGDGRYTMVIAIVSMWTVRVGLGWLLALPAGLGIFGVWIAMIADWGFRSVFFTFRLRGGAWLRRKTA